MATETNGTLPWRTLKVWRFLCDYQAEHGYSPSYAEIGRAVGLSSSSTVSYQLGILQRLGYIERGGRWSPRSIKILRGAQWQWEQLSARQEQT